MLPDALGADVLEHAAHEGAEPIRMAASRLAPRRRGRLARHIAAVTVERTRRKCTVAVGPERRVFYGLFSELGTIHQPAQPWLRPGFDLAKRRAVRAAEKDLRLRLLLRVGRGL